MIYNVLSDYKEFLERTLRTETARTYTSRLESLFEGQSAINTIENLDITKVLDNLSKIKYKNPFSQSKNAFLYFLEFQNIYLNDEQLKQIKDLENNTHKKYRNLKEVDFKEIDKKIKHLKNKKLKVSYQTLLSTGLRVSELAQIKPTDCTISEDEIHFYFVGKGGNDEEVALLKKGNKKLYENLKEMLETSKPEKKIFYSAIYLQKKAKELNFKCHDLRRAFAKLEYKKSKSKENVRKKLRQSSTKTTDIYLKSKVRI